MKENAREHLDVFIVTFIVKVTPHNARNKRKTSHKSQASYMGERDFLFECEDYGGQLNFKHCALVS